MGRGNPNRCRICNRMGGRDGLCSDCRAKEAKAKWKEERLCRCGDIASTKDGYCKNCREKVFGRQDPPMVRDNFIDNYGHNWGKDSFVSEQFRDVKENFDMERENDSLPDNQFRERLKSKVPVTKIYDESRGQYLRVK